MSDIPDNNGKKKDMFSIQCVCSNCGHDWNEYLKKGTKLANPAPTDLLCPNCGTHSGIPIISANIFKDDIPSLEDFLLDDDVVLGGISLTEPEFENIIKRLGISNRKTPGRKDTKIKTISDEDFDDRWKKIKGNGKGLLKTFWGN